jgi:hypothetical protein
MEELSMKNTIYALGLLLAPPVISHADTITFDFTGELIVADPSGTILINNGSTVTPISASLTYDTVTGLGDSSLTLSMSDPYLDIPATFHDISMTRQGDSNLITGQVFVDWGVNTNMLNHVEWDATGLFTAIDFGLQVGDILSGTNLYRDTNGNGIGEAGEWLADISSATPYSDFLQSPNPITYPHISGGPAPLATTSGSLGLDGTTPFPGVVGYFNIGTGNSMHVTSISAVPIPSAIWLFISGILGLARISRRKNTA